MARIVVAKKYELLETNSTNGLYRIKALRDIIVDDVVKVKIGDLGGFIGSEKNLSQKDNCWIHNDAQW